MARIIWTETNGKTDGTEHVIEGEPEIDFSRAMHICVFYPRGELVTFMRHSDDVEDQIAQTAYGLNSIEHLLTD